MRICKECKHLIWYQWWWPYMMGIAEVEERQECDHPKNHEVFHDAVTGENHEMIEPLRSCHAINEDGNCKWFEYGKNEKNLFGAMSEEDRIKLEQYRNSPRKSPKIRWWHWL